MTQVQRGVPIPKRGRVSRYPLRTMDVDASFFIPGMTVAAMCAAASRATKATGRRFTVRQAVENGKAGVRCWRLA